MHSPDLAALPENCREKKYQRPSGLLREKLRPEEWILFTLEAVSYHRRRDFVRTTAVFFCMHAPVVQLLRKLREKIPMWLKILRTRRTASGTANHVGLRAAGPLRKARRRRATARRRRAPLAAGSCRCPTSQILKKIFEPRNFGGRLSPSLRS